MSLISLVQMEVILERHKPITSGDEPINTKLKEIKKKKRCISR